MACSWIRIQKKKNDLFMDKNVRGRRPLLFLERYDIYTHTHIYINMLRSVRSSLVSTSRRRWLHRSDVDTEDLLPTIVPETFNGALSGAGRCGQTCSLSAGISMNKPSCNIENVITRIYDYCHISNLNLLFYSSHKYHLS